MKCLLAALLFVGAALGNSTHRYAWRPQHEYQYRYESKVDMSIPEIKVDQKSGLRLAAVIRVQPQTDYSLLIKMIQPRFLTINGLAHEEVEAPIPAAFKAHLEAVFKVHLKKGVFEAMFVDAAEPIAVTNIKRAIVATLNMDLSASRPVEVLSNHIEVGVEAPVSKSFFKVREQSLLGDCQTIYNIHPLAAYEAMEVEEQLETIEKKRSLKEHLVGGLSQGKVICQGKKYWQITKTRDFDNCVERPVYQKWYGFVGKECDTTKQSCGDLMTHVSSSNYIVCGNDMKDFVIRKSLTENAIAANAAWNIKEKFQTKTEVVLELLKQETITSPLVLPSALVESKSLTFQYPEGSMASSKSVGLGLTEEIRTKVQSETGIRPISPMPDLVSAPKMLVSIDSIEKQEVIRQVVEQLVRLSTEVFTPESSPAKGDAAGYLNIIAKALGYLSLADLKVVETKLESQIATLPAAQIKSIRTLFYDVVAMIGTNPSVMLVKERVLDTTKIDTVQAVSMIQAVVASVRTPTPQLLKELITLVKAIKPLAQQRTMLYNVVLVQLSNLLHRACIAPSRVQAFPVKIYGQFCMPTSEPVVQWIEFLKQELAVEQNQQIKLNIVSAIGKLGHVKAIEILKPIITSVQYNEMVRSLAIYSLQRVAILEPAHVRPILMSIIENIAERPEVRIAAVAILPYAEPTVAELKMIAVRTWMEPSKQVSSFIYSTLKSLVVTEVPELKHVGVQIKSILPLVKPVVLSVQYAQNLHFAKLVNYLEMVVHQEVSWVASPESFIPARMSVHSLISGQEYALQGPAFVAYTRGMEKWIDLIMTYTMKTQTSTQVQTQLKKIVEELSIVKKPIVSPEIFAQAKIYDAEVSTYLNEPMIVDALSKLADELNRDFASLAAKKSFEITKVLKPVEVEGLGPCDAGLPIFIERALPIVVALKGHAEVELEEIGGVKIPKVVKAKVVPAINMKFEMNMGVISPFTEEIIGTGLTIGGHLTTPLEMTVAREAHKVSLGIKIPAEIQSETALIHASITPYTVQKKLNIIAPLSKSATVKPILSGAPLKKMDMQVGAPLDIHARVVAESDAKYSDLYSYLELIRQHNPISLVHTAILPSTIRRSSVSIVFNPVLSKTKEVKVVLGLLYKPASQALSSEKMASYCSQAAPQEAKCLETIRKTMSSLDNQGAVAAARMDVILVGSPKALSAAMIGAYKIEPSTIKDVLRLVSHVELKTHVMPEPYEVKLVSRAELPRVNVLLNKEQLLQQALQVVLNGEVEFGLVSKAKEIIKMKSLLIKSEQQKQSVRASPEYLRCIQEEQLEHPLSVECELVRHQAASVDEIRTELVIPSYLVESRIYQLIVSNVANVAKTMVIGHMIEAPISHVSASDLKIITKIHRVGHEAQMVVEYNGRKYEIMNIRIPSILKGVFPISLRTPFLFVGLNRLSQIVPTCHVAPTHIKTFDSKTYSYQLNDCFHLLFSDSKQSIPVAVMARNINGVSKEVKILAGVAEILMTPISAAGMKIQMVLNGQQEIVQVQPGMVKVIRDVNGLEILHIKRYEDDVYSIHAVQQHLMVLFDGKHAQIFGSPLMRSRAVGLCGDLNAEVTADLKTPQRCIMSQPRLAAYSYMIQEPTCQRIPSQDLAKYEEEKTKCVKQEIIPTVL